ncbi:hypothetical protein OBBRIDRAFT_812877 [Obba rivulosa]|uniref:Uncharacterized protein n=1 Tax=Obba rivulosa TaxID=1052685 RepID=A0A8E2ASE1_9APHY|nr:hypothetical protein OBBRIDRAFT_812877 [Obba rivulosa]
MSNSTSEFKPLLDQSVGYGVVVGVGFFFAALMLVLTTLQAKFSKYSPKSSEEFTSASRSVKPGLVCCGIVSAWTWSATLLQSSTAAYTWYGVGGTIQLAFFAMVAAKVKMNANGAHTFLEIAKVRFGTGAHLLFTFYAFLCILIVCGSLLLGGAATVNALTGMNVIAACFLLPIGIAVYVVFGGLRATFLCDYVHTLILFLIIYLFVGRVYGTSPETGSVNAMYNLLVQAGINTPVVGNQDGSYLTMKSNQGLVFGAATILSGFAGVFCDQAIRLIDIHAKQAIASAPQTTTKAYMLGGLSWFAVPWAFASCLGLAARALVDNPKFPTYPNPLSASQTSAGLAAPAAAAVVMGKGGAIAILLVVFMAVTSAVSSELIAVSSLFLYRTYFRPNASSAEIVRVSHYFICIWAVWAGAWATIASTSDLNAGEFANVGVVLSPAVIPIALTVTWSKLTRAAVFAGCIIGAVLGMLAWMIGCWKIYGTINIANLAEPYSAVCSGLTGLLFSGVITVFVSLAKPDDYDFSGTRAIAVYDIEPAEDERAARKADDESSIKHMGHDEKDLKTPAEVGVRPAGQGPILPAASREELMSVFKRAAWYSLALTLSVAIIVPLPMFFSHYVFNESFYAFWVACTIIWVAMSGVWCIVLPIWESRTEIAIILKGLLTCRPSARAAKDA